jgi:hypothetical protein
MKRLKLLGLALVAMFALTAASASVAGALELTVLPTPSAASPLLYTFKSTAGTTTKLVTLAGKEVKCTSVTGVGDLTSSQLGTVEFKFAGCTGPLGVKCTGLEAGDKEGEILFKAETHLRHLLINNLPSDVHLVILVGHVHFTCFGVLFLVLGCVASDDLKTSPTGGTIIEKLLNSVYVNFLETGGDPLVTSIDNEASTAMETCELKTKEGTGGAYESSGQQGEGTLENFKQNGVAVTLLVHLKP